MGTPGTPNCEGQTRAYVAQQLAAHADAPGIGNYAKLSGMTTKEVQALVRASCAPPLVSIAVSAPAAGIPAGATLQFTATGTYSNGSTRDLTSAVIWSSSDSSIATISPEGLATGVNPGSAVIEADFGPLSGTVPLVVF
jgi:uncharacterized protein YjdB